MRKTSTIIGLAIATILTACISTLSMSNQAFAQRLSTLGINQYPFSSLDTSVYLGQHAGGGQQVQITDNLKSNHPITPVTWKQGSIQGTY